MRILIPVLEKNGENSRVSPHFGRAPYLALISVSDRKITSVDFVAGEGPHPEERSEEEKKAASLIHQKVIDLHPDIIVASRIGPRAYTDFNNAGIRVIAADGETISQVVNSLNI
ncbi:NifB/NifX family molybdenum-iron cluster-binding protein [Thermoplasma sp.]|uniref:NifB/NifX family molybdenum-iron cluster-binding protein n=1 Tax=Thermoplasma sp. TaxID=1973142 RepID=UPI0025F0CF37|nr:NifB/NifX family molybdenum-iron cluster-binding protein [Thermoplasma sp.]